MDVTLLYFDGCPSWQTTDQRLRQLATELDLTVTHQTPDGPAGSPTLGS